MKQYIIKLLFIISCIGFIACTIQNKTNTTVSPYPEDLKQLHENVIAYHLNLPVDLIEIKKNLQDLKLDGSFASIDYTNKVGGRWPVKKHLEYVKNLAIAYKNKSSEVYLNKELSLKIQNSLNYWLNNDFLSTNWWDQHIGVPELLLPTLFLMEEELSKAQIRKATNLLHRAKIKMTGQNKVWLSTNVMLRSLLLRKPDSVAIASRAIQGELKISNGVGIKADWSYHEHGAQLQFGNYGLSFLEDMIKCYAFVNETPFIFKEDKIKILRNYILKGQQWVIWNENYDVSASGRHLFPNEQTHKFKLLKASINQMKLLDTSFLKAYENAENSKFLEGNKLFWKSDFQVHRKNNFYFSVKMSSKRTIGTESVNQENIQGYYLGDGVALLYSNGAEYKNIFPFWDWKKLPGTTLIQDKKPLPIIKFSGFKTNSEFVGGVSSINNGIAVLNYNRDGLKAKKSWFMFDDLIVCLGNTIEAKTNFPVVTTINQTFLKGAVVVSKNGSVEEKFKSKEPINLDWMLHDGSGYLFPTEEKVHVVSRFLAGSWNAVVKRSRPVILTESTLKVWFDHGKNPKNKSYEYILVPNANQQKMVKLQEEQPFKMVNLKNKQSVVSKDGTVGGVIFYKAGASNLLGGFTVDKPCTVMFERDNKQVLFFVSDPTQKLKELTILFENHFIAGKTKKLKQLKLTLPKGNDAGKTTSFFLEE